MGRTGNVVSGTLAALISLACIDALADELVVEDASGSYRYPADCGVAFENSAGIERHMRARGHEGELNEFNHRCSVYLSGGPIARTGTGIRAIGNDMVDHFWRRSGAREFINGLGE